MSNLGHPFLRLTPQQAQMIRMRCLGWVQEIQAKSLTIKPMSPEQALELAKMVEKWSFGGFAPLVAEPTPLNTVEEAIEALRVMMLQMVAGCATQGKLEALRNAMAQLERFAADADAAIQMQS